MKAGVGGVVADALASEPFAGASPPDLTSFTSGTGALLFSSFFASGFATSSVFLLPKELKKPGWPKVAEEPVLDLPKADGLPKVDVVVVVFDAAANGDVVDAKEEGDDELEKALPKAEVPEVEGTLAAGGASDLLSFCACLSSLGFKTPKDPKGDAFAALPTSPLAFEVSDEEFPKPKPEKLRLAGAALGLSFDEVEGAREDMKSSAPPF